MCLHHITDVPKQPWKYGYKVFGVAPEGTLRSPCQGQMKEIPTGAQVDEAGYRYIDTLSTVKTDTGALYSVGWHSFRYKKDANAWSIGGVGQTVRNVVIEEPVTYGKQVLGFVDSLAPVVVSRYITVLEV